MTLDITNHYISYTDSTTHSVSRGQSLLFNCDWNIGYFCAIKNPVSASYGINYALESVSIDGEGRILQHRSGDSVTYSYDYYLKDHLGSTRMVINDQNSITEKVAYQSYGTINPLDSSSPALPSREKFTGKEFDTQGADFARVEFDIAVKDYDMSTGSGFIRVTYKDVATGNNFSKIYKTRYDSRERSLRFTGSESFTGEVEIEQMLLMVSGSTGNIFNTVTVDSFMVSPGKTRKIQLDVVSSEIIGAPIDSSFYNIHAAVNNSSYFSGTRLFYFGARYYDPELGIWMSVDPVKQFANSYLYCHTNPIMYLDKDGRFDTFMHFFLGQHGNPLAAIIPGNDFVRGFMQAIPDVYNHLAETCPRLAKFLGLEEGSRREEFGSLAHGLFEQGNYQQTLENFWKKDRPYGITRFEWEGAKWHVAQDYWEGKLGMSLSQLAVQAIGGKDALEKYQDHIHGYLFAGAWVLGPVVPSLSEVIIADYFAAAATLNIFSAFTYASFEYDKHYGEGAFKQNMKEEVPHFIIEKVSIPAAVAIDLTATTVGLVASIVKRIQRWFK